MLPTALALGAGSEFRAPMAIAVIGGLITSTLLTLIVVPVAYAVLDDFTGWLSLRVRKWTTSPAEYEEFVRERGQRHKGGGKAEVVAGGETPLDAEKTIPSG